MRRSAQAGFSLLEILVVLFVMVMITAMVSLNVSSGGQDIKLTAQMRGLADLAGYALDEAQLTGEDRGLLVDFDFIEGERIYRYSWRERRPEGWRQPNLDAELFRRRQLPPGLELELQLEDLSASEFEAGDSEKLDATPQVIFFASGEVLPGELILRDSKSGDPLWRLQWDLLGRFEFYQNGRLLDENPEDD